MSCPEHGSAHQVLLVMCAACCLPLKWSLMGFLCVRIGCETSCNEPFGICCCDFLTIKTLLSLLQAAFGVCVVGRRKSWIILCVCVSFWFFNKEGGKGCSVLEQVLSWIRVISSWMAQYKWGNVQTALGEGTFSSLPQITVEIAQKTSALNICTMLEPVFGWGKDWTPFHQQHRVELAAWPQLKVCA